MVMEKSWKMIVEKEWSPCIGRVVKASVRCVVIHLEVKHSWDCSKLARSLWFTLDECKGDADWFRH